MHSLQLPGSSLIPTEDCNDSPVVSSVPLGGIIVCVTLPVPDDEQSGSGTLKLPIGPLTEISNISEPILQDDIE